MLGIMVEGTARGALRAEEGDMGMGWAEPGRWETAGSGKSLVERLCRDIEGTSELFRRERC